MKRNRNKGGDSEYNSVKKNKSQNQLPVEMWRMVFSYLPFSDQVCCRSVCRDWLELIQSLPEFKNKTHIYLNYCTLSKNAEPLKTLLKSKIQFTSMKIGSQCGLKYYPSITRFFAKISETVTYLDISQHSRKVFSNRFAVTDSFRIVVENLSLFKVLHHLNIGHIHDWLQVCSSQCSEQAAIESIIYRIWQSNTENISSEAVKNFIDSEAVDDLDQSIFLYRYRTQFLDYFSVFDGLYGLDLYRNYWSCSTVSDMSLWIVRSLRETEQRNNDYLSSKINKSVQVLSIDADKLITEKNLKSILVLVPNVQEINTHTHQVLKTHLTELFNTYPEKIISVTIPKAQRIRKTQCNLQHLSLDFWSDQNSNEFIDDCVQLYPSIKTLSVSSSEIPQTKFDFITELNLDVLVADVSMADFYKFKNLSSLTLSISKRDRQKVKCSFRNHEVVALSSIKKLQFYDQKGGFTCIQCIATLFQSVPNVRKMKFTSKHQNMEIILKYLPNLESMEIENSEFVFNPADEWPDMKQLKYLELRCKKIVGDENSWKSLGKKFSKLKYFKIDTEKCSRNLLETIGSNLPELRKIRKYYFDDYILNWCQPSKTSTFVKERRTFSVEVFPSIGSE